MLALKEIEEIFALSVRSISFVINLLVSSTNSQHFHPQQDGYEHQDESSLLTWIEIYAQHNRFAHWNR
jgi:hypothetical protein